jgi:hypothetical protein
MMARDDAITRFMLDTRFFSQFPGGVRSPAPVTSPPLHTGGPRVSFCGIPFEFDEPPFQPTEPERCGISAPDLAAIIRDIARGS